MTAAVNIKLTHTERDLRLFAEDLKGKKVRHLGKKREKVPFLLTFQGIVSEHTVTI